MPYESGPLPDTLLVDGVDIQAISGIVVTNLDGLLAPGERKGDNVPIPGRNGVLGVPKDYADYEFSIGIRVEGDTRWEMIATLRTVAAALDGDGGLVTLTRRLADGPGTYVEHSAEGQFNNGLQIALLNAATGDTELSFTNNDGCWFDDSSPTTPIVP